MAKKDHGASQAQQLAQQQQLQAQQAAATAAQPTPLQARLEKSDLDFLNSIESPDFDVTKTAALNPYLSLYNNAVSNRNADMAGTGVLRLGTNTQNPNIAASQARLIADKRKEVAGGALANALNVKTAEVTGSALPLIQTDVNRNLSLAGMSNSAAQGYWNDYFRAKSQPAWWQTMLGGLAGGAAAGMSGADKPWWL